MAVGEREDTDWPWGPSGHGLAVGEREDTEWPWGNVRTRTDRGGPSGHGMAVEGRQVS